MSRSQIEILIESIANLHLQLSASLARESGLREVNERLANQLLSSQSVSSSGGRISNLSDIEELDKANDSTRSS